MPHYESYYAVDTTLRRSKSDTTGSTTGGRVRIIHVVSRSNGSGLQIRDCLTEWTSHVEGPVTTFREEMRIDPSNRRGDGAAPRGLTASPRPQVKGKSLYWDGYKQYVRGVTYGTFRPNENGELFPEPRIAALDIGLIAASGFNAVRTYTTPPEWMLDQFRDAGLRVMVGLPWEQHVAFLDSRSQARGIRATVKRLVKSCHGHPAILCYAIGNEIPAPIVRWHGRHAVSDFLRTLYSEVKSVDPDGLVTYVNYPTTEFLDLSFLDFASFNVYLESATDFGPYLARLQTLTEEQPLIMAEIGLDSLRHGEEGQAESLSSQIQASFEGGCAGVFAFKWTDEWFRGGHDIVDWKFGLTTAERVPKPALTSVKRAMRDLPVVCTPDWPKVSVVVCSYNGARTISDTLDALEKLEYPDYEVIVVNDGSNDETPDIVETYSCRLVTTDNEGLSNARNEGLRRATGEIVAYIDDDAYPDPHWLQYLVHTLRTADVCGAGGPNLLPPQSGPLAECVSHAPGGPCHVLDTDQTAEHIPGCNMAFWKSALEEVDGFDPQFRTAGDDVDLCWRLLDKGWKIGFHHAAVVWHHRRPSLRTYFKQQFGYGKAEALLERKWPNKYNRLGHVPWSGTIYGRGLTEGLSFRPSRIYQGFWGQAPFQSLYERDRSAWLSLPLMPEWYLTIFVLLLLSSLGFVWSPLLLLVPVVVIALAAPIVQAIRSAYSAPLEHGETTWSRCTKRTIIAYFHLLQPAARLYGRLSYGLTMWRRRGAPPSLFPLPRQDKLWSEIWHSAHDWLTTIERMMTRGGASVLRGGAFDRWDLEIRGGLWGSARILMAVEEHGSGRQLLRFRCRPVLSLLDISMFVLPGILAVVAFTQSAMSAGLILGAFSTLILAWQIGDCSVAMTNFVHALKHLEEGAEESASSTPAS